jgi:hypothetical protein
MADSFVGSLCCYTNSRDTTLLLPATLAAHLGPKELVETAGKFAANGAWLAVKGIAHKLARWTARVGLGEGIVTTKTLRRRLFGLVGRLTRSARRFTLHRSCP